MPASPSPAFPSFTILEPIYPELHRHIRQLASHDTSVLRALILTCRQWHDAYLPLLYERVLLDEKAARKFLYGWGGQYGPEKLLEAGGATRWAERAMPEAPRRVDWHGEEGAVKARDAEKEHGVLGMDSYWTQTHCGRLQTRASLVHRLELLDGDACAHLASLTKSIHHAYRTIIDTSYVENPLLYSPLFPACESVVFRQPAIERINEDCRPYSSWVKCLLVGPVSVPLAGNDTGVDVYFPDGPLAGYPGTVSDIVTLAGSSIRTLTLHNMYVEGLMEYIHECPDIGKLVVHLQPQPEDMPFVHGSVADLFLYELRFGE
ncbi:hypothetical protein IAT38_002141 [Cryptococcus sp. DSM 104549]